MSDNKKSSFKGTVGFVLAAAGSAVGLGNIWRFPYLAAKDGGGLFMIIYVVLSVTFGFSLLMTEVAIGRKTKCPPLTAYKKVSQKWGWLGILGSFIPVMMLSYYVCIGGWVLKYFVTFITGNRALCAQDSYFGDFTSGIAQPIFYMVIFVLLGAAVVLFGVDKGIEKVSKVLMPSLFVLIVGILVFSLTLKNTNPDGTVVTGLHGLKEFLIPDLEGMTVTRFFRIVMDVVGQLFYSLSIAAGIMITYGSYVPDKTNLATSVGQIEICDTVVAFLAGMMIVPAIYVFSGKDGMSQGASLMFVSLPKIFNEMGLVGTIFGTLFFGMVIFAAITSSVSLQETMVATAMEKLGLDRKKSTILSTVVIILAGTVICLGFNVLKFEVTLPNGDKGSVLEVVDYIVSQIALPIAAILATILIGWVVKPEYVISEVTKNGERFTRAKIYSFIIKYFAPLFLFILLLMSFGIIPIQ